MYSLTHPGPPPPEPAVPTALTRERLVALCQERGWHYFIDSDDGLGGHWINARYYFLIRGGNNEILVVHGLWNRVLPIEHLETVRSTIRQWHRTRIWPTLSHSIDDDGTILVKADYAVDLEAGVTDAQLADHVDRAIATSGSFFTELDNVVDADCGRDHGTSRPPVRF